MQKVWEPQAYCLKVDRMVRKSHQWVTEALSSLHSKLVRYLHTASRIPLPSFKSWVGPPYCHPGSSASKRDFCSALTCFSKTENEGISCLHSSLWWNYALQANCLDSVQWDKKPYPFHIGFYERVSNGFHHQMGLSWWLHELLEQYPGLSSFRGYWTFLS